MLYLTKKVLTLEQKNLTPFFKALKTAQPEAKTELDYVNNYTLLIAVVLSAQSTDAGVNKATLALFQKVKTPGAMISLGLEALRGHIKTIGLYPTKARHIMALSERLLSYYEGQVPDSLEALMTLPGVGRKTANVVLNVAFGRPTIPVDTHVFRVARRAGLSMGKTPEAVEKELLACVPKPFLAEAHHLLILHGRYVCKARRPLCDICSVSRYCAFFKKMASKRQR